MAPVEIVVFDLGGVLIELRGVGAMRELAGIGDDDELWRRWLTCRWVRDFERGACTAEAFAAGVVRDWGLAVAPAAFLESFAAWPGDPLAGAVELLHEVAAVDGVRLACLSNTNALHWERCLPGWSLLDLFDDRLLSFELGLVKPDRELFDRVAELLPSPPGRVLLLDDNLLNVEGARDAGFAAAHVRGPDEARAALVEAGVLRSRIGD